MKTLNLSFAAMLLASPLHAAVILVDFGSSVNNTTAEPQTWTNFNDITGGVAVDLIDTTNNNTGYTMTLSGTVSGLNDSPAPAAPTAPPSPFTPFTVTRDGIFDTGTRTLTISGLDSGLTYSFSLYGYVNRNTTRLTRYSINGTDVDIEPARLTDNTSGGVATFNDIAPTGGNIVITLSSQASTNWILNGMSITYIPEPSALLLSLAAAPFFLRRKRR